MLHKSVGGPARPAWASLGSCGAAQLPGPYAQQVVPVLLVQPVLLCWALCYQGKRGTHEAFER